MNTVIKRDTQNKWTAKTQFPIPNTEMFLNILTMKFSQGVATTCQAVKIEDKGTYKTESFVMFADYRATIIKSHEVKRLTASSVELCHKVALEQSEDFIRAAAVFYSKKEIA